MLVNSPRDIKDSKTGICSVLKTYHAEDIKRVRIGGMSYPLNRLRGRGSFMKKEVHCNGLIIRLPVINCF